MNEDPKPEVPRSEPEIIPPGGNGGRRPGGDSRVWISIDRGDGRTEIKQPGPLSVTLIVIAVIVAVALILTFVLGALLIWVPLVAVIAVGAVLVGYIRGFFRRPI